MWDRTFRIIRYNLINVCGTLVLIFIQVLNLTKFSKYYSFENVLFLLIFWPLWVLMPILSFNKKILKNTIRQEIKYNYLAENMELDIVDDNGTLSLAMFYALPTTNKIKKRKHENSADLLLSGNLDDIEVKFEINEFKRKINYGIFGRVATRFEGDAISLEFTNSLFTKSWSTFVNNQVKVKDIAYKQPNSKVINTPQNIGTVHYENNATAMQLAVIELLIASCQAELNTQDPICVIFKDNKCVIFRDSKKRFNFGITPIVTNRKYTKLVANQKINILQFKQMLLNFNRSVLDLGEGVQPPKNK